MQRANSDHQTGFALLVFIIILLGVGGLAVAGLTQKISTAVDEKRIKHNKRVLQEAKQALLMYAYRHPQFNGTGPGRLPCPDDDDDGDTGTLSTALCESVGRLPWDDDDLQFYDARDASNERLWYAVSDSFYNFDPGGGSIVNSTSQGSITLFDQSGSIIYDGAATGLAAIIIAPGGPVSRDENNDGVYEYKQVRGTNAQKVDPRNYLDTFSGFDNSSFNNGDSDDGFILGPIIDASQNTVVVNDQIEIITTEEIVTMAQKAVMETYRDAIDGYRNNTSEYPWLFDYWVGPAFDLNRFPASANKRFGGGSPLLTNIGRVPIMAGGYFLDDSNSGSGVTGRVEVESTLGFDVEVEIDVDGTTLTLPSLSGISTESDIWFDQAGDDEFELVVASVSPAFNSDYRYFWDDRASPDGWELCADGADQVSDCNRDPIGNNPLSPPNFNWHESIILRVRLSFPLTVNAVFNFSAESGSWSIDHDDPTYDSGLDIAEHAFIDVEVDPDDVNSNPIVVEYEQDDEYDIGFMPSFDVSSSASQSVGIDAGFGEIDDVNLTEFDLRMRYYPEVPNWVAANNWHHEILMGIAPDALIGGSGNCLSGAGCLSVTDLSGTTNNKVSLFVMPGPAQAMVEDDGDGDFSDELADIFDGENADIDSVFRKREGNDLVMIVEEQ